MAWHQRFAEHMGYIKACPDCLGVPISLLGLYGSTDQVFVIDSQAATLVRLVREAEQAVVATCGVPSWRSRERWQASGIC